MVKDTKKLNIQSSSTQSSRKACLHCTESKLKCDLRDPACARCLRLRLRCIFDPLKRFISLQEDVWDIENQMQDMEEIITQNMPSLQDRLSRFNEEYESESELKIASNQTKTRELKQKREQQQLNLSRESDVSLHWVQIVMRQNCLSIETNHAGIYCLEELISQYLGPNVIPRSISQHQSIIKPLGFEVPKDSRMIAYAAARKHPKDNALLPQQIDELIPYLVRCHRTIWHWKPLAPVYPGFDFQFNPSLSHHKLMIYSLCAYTAEYGIKILRFGNYNPHHYRQVEQYFMSKAQETLFDITSFNIETLLSTYYMNQIAISIGNFRLGAIYHTFAVRIATHFKIHEHAASTRLLTSQSDMHAIAFAKSMWAFILTAECNYILSDISPCIYTKHFLVGDIRLPEISASKFCSMPVHIQDTTVMIYLLQHNGWVWAMISRIVTSRSYSSLIKLELELRTAHPRKLHAFINLDSTGYVHKSRLTVLKILRYHTFYNSAVIHTYTRLLPLVIKFKNESTLKHVSSLIKLAGEIFDIYELSTSWDPFGDYAFRGQNMLFVCSTLQALWNELKSDSIVPYLSRCLELYRRHSKIFYDDNDLATRMAKLTAWMEERNIALGRWSDLPTNLFFEKARRAVAEENTKYF